MSDESAGDLPIEPVAASSPAASTPAEPAGLPARVWGGLSVSRVQPVLGLLAALLSISGGLYGYLRPVRPPHAGDVVAVVQDARSGRTVRDATVEILTPRDALVTTLGVVEGEARGPMKEGRYRLRVTHPRFATEVRQIQVIAGQTTAVRVRLSPRAAASR
jgi:hypothetical protein